MKTLLHTLAFFLIFLICSHGESSAPAASNAFAFDCLAALSKEKGNVAFSPYSVWTALTMTSAGAAGGTLSNMLKVLEIPKDEADSIHSAAAAWQKDLSACQDIELKTANRLWGNISFTPENAFIGLLKKDYGASLERLDFTKDPETARQTINRWVAQQTANRIKDLLPPSAIKAHTQLILTNAIYFKAGWKIEFDPKDTDQSPFHLPDGKTAEVKMMSLTSELSYFETDKYQAVLLSYRGGATSMLLVLPARDSAFHMDASAYQTICQGLTPRKVKVGLPRFTVEQKMEMIPLLASMGMRSPFDGSADFSRLSSKVKLKIGNVIHQAFVKVGEKGTEAAAATAVAMELAMARPPEDKPIVFWADRPFYFFILHDPTQGILFAGRVENPSES